MRSVLRLGILGALWAVLTSSAWAQTGFLIIVHPSTATSSLAEESISRLFLKKDVTWSGGAEALPVDQMSDSALRNTFSEAVHGRTTAQIQSYWQQQLFSGSGVPPAELADDAAVVAFVRNNPGAIGYISDSTPADGVKLLSIGSGDELAAASSFPPLTSDMTAPRLLETVDPEYPLVARRARYECALTVRAQIDETGKVIDVTVVTPCARFKKQLNESALKAIRRWTFEPALSVSGEATPVTYAFQVWFTL